MTKHESASSLPPIPTDPEQGMPNADDFGSTTEYVSGAYVAITPQTITLDRPIESVTPPPSRTSYTPDFNTDVPLLSRRQLLKIGAASVFGFIAWKALPDGKK